MNETNVPYSSFFSLIKTTDIVQWKENIKPNKIPDKAFKVLNTPVIEDSTFEFKETDEFDWYNGEPGDQSPMDLIHDAGSDIEDEHSTKETLESKHKLVMQKVKDRLQLCLQRQERYSIGPIASAIGRLLETNVSNFSELYDKLNSHVQGDQLTPQRVFVALIHLAHHINSGHCKLDHLLDKQVHFTVA